MTAGDTKVLEVTVLDGDGEPVDITGTTIRWQLARLATDDTPLITKSVGDGIAIVDGAAGRFDVTLDPEDTAELGGSYYYEAEIDDADVISTVLSGRATIDAALIKP
jgi:hypothetical protein